MTDTSPFSLAGSRVLISGASGGIGRATAKLCTDLGADIVLVDLKAPEDVAAAASGGRKAEAYGCDLSDRSEVERLAGTTGRVDAVVDLAAICPAGDWHVPGWNDELMRVLSVNVGGPLNLMHAYFPMMLDQGAGRVVLTGSLAGHTGGLRAAPHYAASKGAVHALVRWFAQRGTPKNVLVNGIAPGTTDTPMILNQGYDPTVFPQKRFGRPEEIAGAVVFLLSPASSFVSGVILDVNGGIYYS